MENFYSTFLSKRFRPNIKRSNLLPLFNTHLSNYEQTISPDAIKLLNIENRLKYLEKLKMEQNDKINALISYQMNQNRLRNNFVPANVLLLSADNILPPIGYHLKNTQPIEKKYYIIKADKDKYKKERIIKEYKKNIDNLKNLLEKEKGKRIKSRKIRNIYMQIRKGINHSMDEMNYNIQKKLQNDNDLINAKINNVQKSYEEMKYLLNDRMDKFELKQKIELENLKNDLIKSENQRQKERDILNELIENKLNNSRNKYSLYLEKQLRNQRESDEIKYQKEIEELRHRQELADMENRLLMEDLRFNNMGNSVLPKIILPPPLYMLQQYPIPFM